MNVVVISEDLYFYKTVKEIIENLDVSVRIKKYKKIDTFLETVIAKKIDVLIIDVKERKRLRDVYEISLIHQGVHLILASSNLEIWYSSYLLDIDGFIDKNNVLGMKYILENVFLKKKNAIHFLYQRSLLSIDLKNIYYFESFEGKTIIHTKYKDWITYKHIDQFMNENKTDFLRIHQSFLVNKQKLNSISKKRVVLINGTQLPVSKKFMDCIFQEKEET